MAAHSFCVHCQRNFREDTAHEIYGCPQLRTNPKLAQEQNNKWIDEEIEGLEKRIQELKARKK